MASPAGASSGNRCAASRTSRISVINCFLSFERRCRTFPALPRAEVAELVDALASGASGGNPVEVQILSSAPPDPDPPAIRDCARTARAPARGRRPAIRPGQARSYPATRGPRGGAPRPRRLIDPFPVRRPAVWPRSPGVSRGLRGAPAPDPLRAGPCRAGRRDGPSGSRTSASRSESRRGRPPARRGGTPRAR